MNRQKETFRFHNEYDLNYVHMTTTLWYDQILTGVLNLVVVLFTSRMIAEDYHYKFMSKEVVIVVKLARTQLPVKSEGSVPNIEKQEQKRYCQSQRRHRTEKALATGCWLLFPASGHVLVTCFLFPV